MIGRIVEFSVRNRTLVLLMTFGLVVWGAYALYRTPVDAIPDLSENQVIVWADWPGRSPQEVEDQITYPLSVNLQGLAGVKAVRATSEFGFSMINIIFDDSIDFYFARQRVIERLSIASTFLPMGVVPYLAPDATALGQIFWYTVEGEGKSLDELRAIQDWYVRYQLNSVPGVAQVASVGGFVREYQIDVSPDKLRAYNVSLGQVFSAVAGANSAVGGKVIHKGGSEYLVRGAGYIRSLRDIETVVVAERDGVPLTVERLGTVQLGPAFRRGALEKDGREAVGGVVMMRFGENPLDVTDRVKAKIQDLQVGLPAGVRIVPFYDRTPLIHAAIQTLTGTLVEEIIIATIVVMLVLVHLRSAIVICITLPLAILVSFVFMYYLNVPSNIMSLSGIAISIGVLLDAGIVMTENAYHRLHDHFPDHRVRGNTVDIVIGACKIVGGPLFFSILVMLISFAPVFALGGIEGKMFHPLAFTKSFALVGVAILAVTLVPALIPWFVRGKLKSETDVWLVRSFVNIYKPMLEYFFKHPDVIVVITGFFLVVGLPFFPAKMPWTLFVLVVPFLWTVSAVLVARRPWRCLAIMVLIAIGSFSLFKPLGVEFMPPLDEGSIMDMPVTRPNVNITQAVDDIKSRNAVLRTFPEVSQVVGKVGRAETETDPAPVDMVETVVMMKPKAWWPKRKINYEDVLQEARQVRASLEGWGAFGTRAERAAALKDAAAKAAEALDFLAQQDEAQGSKTIGAGEALSDGFDLWNRLEAKGRITLPHPTTYKAAFTTATPLLSAALGGAAPPGELTREQAYLRASAVLRGELSLAVERVLADEDEALANNAAMEALASFDRDMRDLATRRFEEFVPEMGRELLRTLRTEVETFLIRKGLGRVPDDRWAALEENLLRDYAARFDEVLLLEDVTKVTEAIVDEAAPVRKPKNLIVAADLAAWVEEQQKAFARDEGRPVFARLREEAKAILARKNVPNVTAKRWERIDDKFAAPHVSRFDVAIEDEQVLAAAHAMVQDLAPGDLLVEPESPLEAVVGPLRAISGRERPTLFQRLHEGLEHRKDELMQARVKRINYEIEELGPARIEAELHRQMVAKAREANLLVREPSAEELHTMGGARAKAFGAWLFFWPKLLSDVRQEMDADLRVPGWSNIWTRPIQNRVDMLATGVNTDIGVRVFGEKLEEIQDLCNRIAAALKGIPGAVDVSADPVVGENYLEISIDRERAARYGVNVRDVQDVIEVALGGKEITMTVEGRARFPVRVRYPRDWRDDEERVKSVLVAAGGAPSGGMDGMEGGAAASGMVRQIPLSMVADIHIRPGPSMIKSENGRNRLYVRLNVRDRDPVGFVEEAQRVIESRIQLPPGYSIEWTGQFEHQKRAERTLVLVVPLVMLLTFVVLYMTYRDFLDTVFMFLAVPGAIAGGAIFQALWGHNFSVAVMVGFIACMGLATETGIVMMVYLREAIHKRGGLEKIRSEEEIKAAAIEGAVHRLRPKLLTEGTTVLALIPMLWATGVGAEFMRPMAAPILGGVLIADEVIDIFIPVLFYWSRCRRWRKLRKDDRGTVRGMAVPIPPGALPGGDA